MVGYYAIHYVCSMYARDTVEIFKTLVPRKRPTLGRGCLTVLESVRLVKYPENLEATQQRAEKRATENRYCAIVPEAPPVPEAPSDATCQPYAPRIPDSPIKSSIGMAHRAADSLLHPSGYAMFQWAAGSPFLSPTHTQ